MSFNQTVQIVEYLIGDHDENIYHADNNKSFEDTDDLLQKFREENPECTFTMFAEIDA